MTNNTQVSKGKQIQISEHQLRRLLEFVSIAKSKFNELSTLTRVITEKTESCSTNHTLSCIAFDMATNMSDECLSEFQFFKEFSPELVADFAEELAA